MAPLAAVVDDLVDEDVDGLPDAALAEEVLALRRLMERLEGRWLKGLAAVDGRSAAGAEQGIQAASTASWLRNRLHLGAAAASSCVRTARALFAGPLPGTAQALCDGELSAAHAAVLAHGTHHLPTHTTAQAEPVLVAAARRLDPPRLRRAVAHLLQATDPDDADGQAERRHGRRGVWWATTLEGMVALQGLLDPEAGQTLTAALEPLARPATAADARSGDQRRADALTELARRALEAGQLPQTGGVRPQLSVIVDLASLLGRPGALGGELGGAGPLAPEACGAPSQPLDVGRASRVVTPAQRSALAVRDGGCVVPDCTRPLSWCEGHHLWHWVDGGPTDLANLALVCRAHHRAVHEGGWQLTRGPDGRFTATPPHRQPRTAA